MKHFLSVTDAKKEIFNLLDLAQRFKKNKSDEKPLAGKTLAMIFEKASTRTRISFEVAMFQLGGIALYLSAKDLQLGRGELIEDTARAMSRYVDAVMIRAKNHSDVLKFAKYSDVPVINGLTDLEHPCQALADLQTIYEYKKTFKTSLAFLGDGNNVCNSLLLASALVGMDMTVVCPKMYQPDPDIFTLAKTIAKSTESKLKITDKVSIGVKGANILYTDVWVSMGNESQAEQRLLELAPYQLNKKILEMADSEAIVMHCLPAVRGQEITDELINSPKSAIWDQAENRLHAQKAVLYKLLKN